jgi:hypothetical protein
MCKCDIFIFYFFDTDESEPSLQGDNYNQPPAETARGDGTGEGRDQPGAQTKQQPRANVTLEIERRQTNFKMLLHFRTTV